MLYYIRVALVVLGIRIIRSTLIDRYAFDLCKAQHSITFHIDELRDIGAWN